MVSELTKSGLFLTKRASRLEGEHDASNTRQAKIKKEYFIGINLFMSKKKPGNKPSQYSGELTRRADHLLHQHRQTLLQLPGNRLPMLPILQLSEGA